MNYMKYLTDADVDAIRRDNKSHGWAYGKTEAFDFIEKYRIGTDKDRASIFCRLEDVNYHPLCDCLEKGDYEGAKAWVNKYWD